MPTSPPYLPGVNALAFLLEGQVFQPNLMFAIEVGQRLTEARYGQFNYTFFSVIYTSSGITWGRIFSHVWLIYEWAVSDLDRSMHRSLWV